MNKHNTDKLIYSHLTHKNMQRKFSTHCHNSFEIIFFIHGDANYIIEERTYQLKKYDLIITRPARQHNIDIVSNNDYERYDILIGNNKGLIDLIAKIPSGYEVINCSNCQTIIDDFKKLDSYAQAFTHEEFIRLLEILLIEVLYNVRIMNNDPSQNYNLVSPLIQKSLAYINENLFTISNISDVSDHLYIAKNYFFKLFKDQMKVPPKKYINNKRLLHAQTLLLKGEKPTAIYEKCGFTNYVSFYKRYIDFFGYPPSEENKS